MSGLGKAINYKTSLILLVVLLVWGASSYSMNSNLINLDIILQSFSSQHILGTDELGRDILARIIDGVQVALLVGISVMLMAGIIGTVVGVVSGYFGGWVDIILMRITDIFLSFPGILMAISFAALAGPGIENVVFALGLMGWVSFARLARIQTMAVKNNDYISSAQINGVGSISIMAVYVLPNIVAPLIVEGVFTIAGAMMAEAGLSFLGIGIQAPDASLGAMLREGARYMLVAPHLVMVPGAVLMLLVLTLNLIGDKLRDKLDVRG